MMREILFRGKRIDNGEWIYGWLGSLHCCNSQTKEIKSVYFTEMSENFDCRLNIIVDYKTIGQYTGLTDKKGVKIFEGDIVECWSEGVKARGTVTHRIDGLWIIFPAWQKRIMWGLCPDNDGNTTVEVIGNIHDNPELLELLKEVKK